MTGEPAAPFSVEPTTLPPGVVVRGEVDIAVAQRLDSAIDRAIEDSVGAFIIDLTDVDFLDSSGLNVLVRARGLLGRQDRALALICGPGPVQRLLELSGLAGQFVVFGTPDEAAGALIPADC